MLGSTLSVVIEKRASDKTTECQFIVLSQFSFSHFQFIDIFTAFLGLCRGCEGKADGDRVLTSIRRFNLVVLNRSVARSLGTISA